MTFLETDRLSLRPLLQSDLDGNYSKWLNNPEIVVHNSHGRFPHTLNGLKQFIETANNSSRIVLAILYKETQEHIGNISLQGINWIDRSAEIAFLLGEKNYWGKGVMKEAGLKLIEHAFHSLNLHRVHCGTSINNIGMQKLALALGMEKEGVRREAIFNQGKYLDLYEYGILNTNG